MNFNLNEPLFVFLVLVGLYILIKLYEKISLELKNRTPLPTQLKSKADWKFRKLYLRFKKQHKRSPTHPELFRLIINASHITIRRRGQKVHWGRQKIRKYLLEKHDVVKNYTMR